MNMITTQFGKPVLPPKPRRKSWTPTTEERLGQAMAAFCMAETRRKGLTPGKTPTAASGGASSFGSHMVTDDMIAAVIGILETGPRLQREVVAETGLSEMWVRRTIFALKQAGRIRYTFRRVGGRKIRLWHIASPASGRSAPHVAEHEKGKPVTFSQIGERGDLSSPAAPVAPTAAGAQEV